MHSLHVVNPTVAVGFANGSIWLHCADTDRGLLTDDVELLQTLSHFARPAEPGSVIAAARDPEAASRHVAELQRVGALVESEARPSVDAPPEPQAGELVDRYLTPLAIGVDDLAGALASVGPTVVEAIREETGLGVRARLMGALAGVQAVRQAVSARAPGFVRAQLQSLDLPKTGLSVHIGAGSAKLPGWVNLDVWPAELALDLRDGLPFGDDSAERAYLSHTLEHLVYPHQVMGLLREIHRVLAPGGRVRIVVPDIEACIEAYVKDDRRFFEGRSEVWPHWKIRTRLESFLGYAGVGPYPGQFGYSHKFGYDLETLSRVLHEAGFREILRSGFQASTDPAFRVDHASTYAVANVDGRYYSLFVEAVSGKPGATAREPGDQP